MTGVGAVLAATSTRLGFFFTGLAAVLAVACVAMTVGGLPCPLGHPAIVLLVLFLGGIQLISVGILGEYIGRLYEEVRQRLRFIVDRTEGFSADASRK